MRVPALMLFAALAFVWLAPPAHAAPPKADKARQAETAFYEAFKAKDYQKAIDAARFWISVDDDDYVPHYNLATLLGATGRADEGVGQLAAAVERGFADRRRLDTDPGLRPYRETATYKSMIERWPALLDSQLARRETLAKKWWTSKYASARDNDLRVAYAGGIAPEAFGRARDELTRLAAWWEASVLPEGGRNTEPDPVRPDPWVLVILPTRTDYNRWAAKRWPRPSGSTSIVAGIYDHDERQLVAQDVGGTLRHEFCHALHWRSQDRLGQMHPIWIQEGLCSLAEDIEVEHEGNGTGGGGIRPVPSWRTNSLKMLLAGGTPPNLERLLKMDRDAFVSNAPLANYALARSLFLYLFDRGKLREWYTAYTRGYAQDATGKAALESTLGKPLAQVERDFRVWVRALPQVATANRPGGALLPGSYANGTGEGVVVHKAPSAGAFVRTREASGAVLSAGDVIVEVAGQPVTDLNDLTRVLGEFEPGARVELRFRRGGAGRSATMNATMTLVAR